MTKAQAALLKRLIEAERLYFRRVLAAARDNRPPGRREEYVSPNCRLVEVGPINGVDQRTAEALVAAGLAETAVKLGGAERDGGPDARFVRLAHGDAHYIDQAQEAD